MLDEENEAIKSNWEEVCLFFLNPCYDSANNDAQLVHTVIWSISFPRSMIFRCFFHAVLNVFGFSFRKCKTSAR